MMNGVPFRGIIVANQDSITGSPRVRPVERIQVLLQDGLHNVPAVRPRQTTILRSSRGAAAQVPKLRGRRSPTFSKDLRFEWARRYLRAEPGHHPLQGRKQFLKGGPGASRVKQFLRRFLEEGNSSLRRAVPED